MKRVMTEKDSDRSLLKGARIAVVGFGSQGRAHALNLRDSGLDVVIGLRPGGPTAKAAQAEGLKVLSVAEAVRGAKIVCMLVPDMAQAEVYRNDVEPNLADGSLLMFSHGFNIHYNQITPKPTIDVAMIAPKSPGRLVRTQYEAGRGVPCVLAVHQNATGKAFDLALAYADGIGGTRAGVIETTFAEETETDLFGEQAALCGGVTELITAGYETLVDAGYQPEVAYFECLHELKLIVDLIYEGGIARMHQYVSDTAKFGDLTRGPRIVDDHVRAKMKEVLGEIRSGAFASEWVLENKAGSPRYKALLAKDLQHPIEEVGARLRSMMSWLEK